MNKAEYKIKICRQNEVESSLKLKEDYLKISELYNELREINKEKINDLKIVIEILNIRDWEIIKKSKIIEQIYNLNINIYKNVYVSIKNNNADIEEYMSLNEFEKIYEELYKISRYIKSKYSDKLTQIYFVSKYIDLYLTYGYVEKLKRDYGYEFNENEKEDYNNLSNLKCVLTNIALCEGISKMFYHIMHLLNIETGIITCLFNDSKFGHSLNIFKYYGKWYFLDITADSMNFFRNEKLIRSFKGKEILKDIYKVFYIYSDNNELKIDKNKKEILDNYISKKNIDENKINKIIRKVKDDKILENTYLKYNKKRTDKIVEYKKLKESIQNIKKVDLKKIIEDYNKKDLKDFKRERYIFETTIEEVLKIYMNEKNKIDINNMFKVVSEENNVVSIDILSEKELSSEEKELFKELFKDIIKKEKKLNDNYRFKSYRIRYKSTGKILPFKYI